MDKRRLAQGQTKYSAVRRYHLALSVLALVLAAGLLWYRGASRVSNRGSDWVSPYVGARLWLDGANPYDSPSFVSEASKVGLTMAATSLATHVVYPPSAFPLLALISAVSWAASWQDVSWVVALMMTALVPLSAWALASAINLRPPNQFLFVALAMACGPFHTGIAVANPSVLAVGALVFASALWLRNRQALAGVLIGVATVIKPTLGIWFLFALAAVGIWRVVVAAGVPIIALTTVALLRMQIAGIHWFATFVAGANTFFTRGGENDFSAANTQRFNLIQLQVPIFEWVHSASATNVITILIALILGAALVALLRRTDDKLLALSATCVFGLLPVYHRFYDVALIVIPVAWCIREFGRPLARVVFFALVPLFVPGATILQVVQSRVPAELSSAWYWTHVLLPHQILILVLVFFLLIAAGRRRRGVTSPGIPKGWQPVAEMCNGR